jgi:hypothetical protein
LGGPFIFGRFNFLYDIMTKKPVLKRRPTWREGGGLNQGLRPSIRRLFWRVSDFGPGFGIGNNQGFTKQSACGFIDRLLFFTRLYFLEVTILVANRWLSGVWLTGSAARLSR